jgi:M6 family metalloprotease-like protein
MLTFIFLYYKKAYAFLGNSLLGLLLLMSIFPIIAQPADTLTILAIRVDFQTDDDDFTTGDGTFMLDSVGSGKKYDIDYAKHPFDPPPHNRTYFEKHLAALRNYYYAISYKKIWLEYSVYPAAEESVYHLPKKKKEYYSLQKSFSLAQSDSQLITFAQISLACPNSVSRSHSVPLPFDKADCYIVFYAGADGRSDNDDSYGDIPSVYLSFKQYGDSLVTTDSTVIRDALLIPETISQDGVTGVLNATLAFEFGHFLGMPSLFFSQAGKHYGVPAVGQFSLMDVATWLADSGEVYVYGAVPPHPGPWEKIRQGWITSTLIERGSDSTYIVEPMERSGQVYKIPINPPTGL